MYKDLLCKHYATSERCAPCFYLVYIVCMQVYHAILCIGFIIIMASYTSSLYTLGKYLPSAYIRPRSRVNIYNND